jgi:hypothetical protein
MAGPIYKLWQARLREAWYQLSPDAQQQLSAQVEAALEQVGGRRVLICATAWATEEWAGFGVEEFPDIEAVQKHTQLLDDLHWYRYIESRTVLGTLPDDSSNGERPTAPRDATGRSIYKLYQGRLTEAWYQLAADEQKQLGAQVDAARAQVGGRRVLFCNSAWANEEWAAFGVVEFPDAEAAQRHAQLLDDLHWFRYGNTRSMLGVAVDDSP